MESVIYDLTGNEVEQIGNFSAFSKVYRAVYNQELVYILTTDIAKAMLIGLSNPHIPVMNQVAVLSRHTLYQTKYSRSIERTDVQARMTILNLSNSWSMLRDKNERKKKSDRLTRKALVRIFIDSLYHSTFYSLILIYALEQIYSAADITGLDFTLDLPVENFGIADDGTLLLRDIVCFIK